MSSKPEVNIVDIVVEILEQDTIPKIEVLIEEATNVGYPILAKYLEDHITSLREGVRVGKLKPRHRDYWECLNIHGGAAIDIGERHLKNKTGDMRIVLDYLKNR